MEKAKLILPKKPTRSKKADLIKTVDLITNCTKIKLKKQQSICVYEYSIETDPLIEPDARNLLNQIYQNAKKSIREQFGTRLFFKSGNQFYADKKIAEDEIINIDSQIINEEKTLNYMIRLIFIQEIIIDDLDSIGIEGTGNRVTQILNQQIKKLLKENLKLIEIGRNSNYYDINEISKFKIQNQGLSVWRGLKTSVVLSPQQPYIIVDFICKIMRTETVLDYIKHNSDNVEKIIGQSVMAQYGNNRMYKIDDILLDKNPNDTFYYNGQEIRFAQYLKEQYNITITDFKQPLLLHINQKSQKEVYLVPEFMQMTGLEEGQQQNYTLMKDISLHTKLSPQKRMDYINKNLNKIKKAMQSDSSMIVTDESFDNRQKGYILEPPLIEVGNNKKISPFKGNFDLKSNTVYSPGIFENWVLIYQSRNDKDDQNADNFLDKMKFCSKAFGIQVKDPDFVIVKSNNPEVWIKELNQYLGQSEEQPTFIISLIDQRYQNTLYSPLKKFLYKDLGIIHQNVKIQTTFGKNANSIVSKIILQINAKLANPLWKVPRPERVKDRTMLIGIDIYKKLINNSQSCIGFVSTVNEDFTDYYSRVVLSDPKKDTINDVIAKLTKKGIKEYQDYNGFLPEQIVIYRDGVGEGQLKENVQKDVNQIKKAFQQIHEQYQPQFAYIMVNKKCTLKFFSQYKQNRNQNNNNQQNQNQNQYNNNKQQDSIVNPQSGTVVADGVSSSIFDFYMASQNVHSGTCTPTHYTVGYNNISGWPEETFWYLTYYQCFNYYNWSGAVKVPAPVQYAHKLSYLVGETFKSNSHDDLKDCLYYL